MLCYTMLCYAKLSKVMLYYTRLNQPAAKDFIDSGGTTCLALLA